MDKNRGTGRTTRLVDFYIQEMFNNLGEWIEVRDHWDDNLGDRDLFNRVVSRLIYEFNINYRSNIETDESSMRIMINISSCAKKNK